MATGVQPRKKDHWSVRLRVPRPPGGGGAGKRATKGSLATLLALTLLQTVLLYVTTSSSAATGSLYGCPAACGTAALPSVPLAAALWGAATLILPVALGAISRTWRVAVAAAVVPWWLVTLLHASTSLVPTLTFVPGAPTAHGGHVAPVSQFGAPYWLDPAHALPLLLGLGLFAALGAFGWIARQALAEG